MECVSKHGAVLAHPERCKTVASVVEIQTFVCSPLVTVAQTQTDASSNTLRWDCGELGAQLFLSSLCIRWPRN